MLWSIDPKSSIPIYEQIVVQVIFRVASGDLEQGMLIPSVRQLAESLTVHPNTVARAFQDLEKRGVVMARRGRGMEVTSDAKALCQEGRREIVRRRIREVLREAFSGALPKDEIRQLVDEELANVNAGVNGQVK